MQQWRDISIPMFTGMTSWPGDPVFTLEPAARIADVEGFETLADGDGDDVRIDGR